MEEELESSLLNQSLTRLDRFSNLEDIDVVAGGSLVLRLLICFVYSVVCAVGLVVDTALDFSWPFGNAMCKIILSVTVMNMYASVFFLTAMSVTRYCYIMLLRFIRHRSMKPGNPKRRSQVTKSVTIVVLSFFLCWMPNQAITFWSVLVKLNAANWDKAYYIVHSYVFPVTVCLAHANSCLNPIIYCLMRKEFRKKLKDLIFRG
ncbi:unnamed protein product [Arctogadus glacialis]